MSNCGISPSRSGGRTTCAATMPPSRSGLCPTTTPCPPPHRPCWLARPSAYQSSLDNAPKLIKSGHAHHVDAFTVNRLALYLSVSVTSNDSPGLSAIEAICSSRSGTSLMGALRLGRVTANTSTRTPSPSTHDRMRKWLTSGVASGVVLGPLGEFLPTWAAGTADHTLGRYLPGH